MAVLPVSAEHGRLTALDGLRGIAILGVLATHSALHWGLTPLPIPKLDGFLGSTGRVGVELFFVLSAFLITGILLRAKGSPSALRNFYARRALRILPLYYLVLLGVLAIQAPAAISGWEPWYWMHASNWAMAIQGGFSDHGYGVMWSLSIEEQFYAVWPFVVLGLARRRLLLVSLAGVVVALAWRIALVAAGQPASTVIVTTFSHLDALGIGAALAVVSGDARLGALLTPARWTLPLGAAAIGVLGIAAGGLASQDWVALVFGNTLLALCGGAAIILAVAAPPQSVVRRFTEARALRTFGRYSYCLYLIHAPVGETVRLIAYGELWPVLAQLGAFGHLVIWAAIVGVSFALAWLSWRYIENPLLSLKRFLPYSAPDPVRSRSLIVATEA